MYDERHYNCWEQWFKKAYGIEEFSTFNTLWLTYFIAGGSIEYRDQRYAFKKILQTVYTSMADTIGVLFLMRKLSICYFSGTYLCLGVARFFSNKNLKFIIYESSLPI